MADCPDLLGGDLRYRPIVLFKTECGCDLHGTSGHDKKWVGLSWNSSSIGSGAVSMAMAEFTGHGFVL